MASDLEFLAALVRGRDIVGPKDSGSQEGPKASFMSDNMEQLMWVQERLIDRAKHMDYCRVDKKTVNVRFV